MKRITYLLLLAFSISLVSFASTSQLKEKLEALAAVKAIEPLESTHFNEKYLLRIEQPLDHHQPTLGSFQQRVFVSHVGYDRPTVLITEGYGGSYGMSPTYREEISALFNTNIIFVEHRYFLESTPQPLNWDYLTAENSAYDLHAITTMMKQLYPGKWISTGISKGGQTTLLYRAYFPEDVDISVPYVAPLCMAAEDGRHEPFLRKVSTAKNRKKISDYQQEVLTRRETLFPLFEQYCNNKKYAFRAPLNEIFDYCVLEYPFALWQWGTSLETIPATNADDQFIFDHLIAISEPSYFALNQPTASFFVQAARELGYYGYDTTPFEKLLTIKSSKNYLQRLMLPEGVEVPFKPELSQKITRYLKENDPKIIFIYGENDPWTSAGVTYLRGKKNMLVAIEPGGSHKARIYTLPEKLQNKVIDQLTTWLKE